MLLSRMLLYRMPLKSSLANLNTDLSLQKVVKRTRTQICNDTINRKNKQNVRIARNTIYKFMS